MVYTVCPAPEFSSNVSPFAPDVMSGGVVSIINSGIDKLDAFPAASVSVIVLF